MTRYRIATRPYLPYPGERVARRKGLGGEFYELRPYASGDEVRRVHWRAYAKTGRLYTRVETAPERGRFRLFLDESESMRLHGKLPYAEGVARLLLRIARQEDPLARLLRGKPGEWPPGRGTLVLLTDGLDPLPWARVLPRRVVLVQVLSPLELNPPLEEVLLRDVESGESLPVGPEEVRAYREALAAHLRALRLLALLRGRYALLKVGEPPLPALLRQGVLEPL
ncbi:DUF58 domain-containing protein [Thermus thermamylovorans]|uniref:DUF58 domain-containing protein n=1 Tax=Thermus thermamylovorans TaxID=2509362 RepID=A0A4Q9B532_9DEIN|nr:DUF58 domain-containing protein [Thermus thermamylovorans]TBH20694.1 DUF58 domain-containing protein [Thermus thermamylovorans]